VIQIRGSPSTGPGPRCQPARAAVPVSLSLVRRLLPISPTQAFSRNWTTCDIARELEGTNKTERAETDAQDPHAYRNILKYILQNEFRKTGARERKRHSSAGRVELCGTPRPAGSSCAQEKKRPGRGFAPVLASFAPSGNLATDLERLQKGCQAAGLSKDMLDAVSQMRHFKSAPALDGETGNVEACNTQAHGSEPLVSAGTAKEPAGAEEFVFSECYESEDSFLPSPTTTYPTAPSADASGPAAEFPTSSKSNPTWDVVDVSSPWQVLMCSFPVTGLG
jgi:hypothetical protein